MILTGLLLLIGITLLLVGLIAILVFLLRTLLIIHEDVTKKLIAIEIYLKRLFK